jgi:hypothetical protein
VNLLSTIVTELIETLSRGDDSPLLHSLHLATDDFFISVGSRTFFPLTVSRERGAGVASRTGAER